MKILLATGTPYLPQVRGGVEVNTHELATELTARGHAVSVLARLSYRDLYGLRTGLAAALRRQAVCDDNLGYPVFRSREPWKVTAALDAADVAVIQNGDPVKMVEAFAKRSIPSIIYHHGLGFETWPTVPARGHPALLPVAGYLSISQFTADRFRARYGIVTEVIPPVFRPEQYRTEGGGKYVTFINPVAVKGVEVALAIATRCRTIPFCFVMGWPLSPLARTRLMARLKALPNVTFRERVEMRTIYRETRILLAPSQWEAETWGRVASEAHYSGIPVVASDRGGLPESVGPGGVIIPHDAPVDHWVNAITRLWNNEFYYREMSAAALAYSERPALDINHQTCAFEVALGRMLGRSVPASSTEHRAGCGRVSRARGAWLGRAIERTRPTQRGACAPTACGS